MGYLAFDSLPEPGDRYVLGEIIGVGSYAKVYKAQDTQNNNKLVAIKVQRYEGELIQHIEEEYRILRDYNHVPNLPDFFGVYRRKCSEDADQIWFILEYCEGGSILNLVQGLHAKGRAMKEEHIAFILREVIRALLELHKNYFVHRDIRCNNILIKQSGQIRIVDFGLTRNVGETMGKRNTCIGSPYWMSPEMVTATGKEDKGYGSRCDVWALGITAIELGDGRSPFHDMHPTRAMFQIVRNPPPTLLRPSMWSQNLNDFISECLEKNPENRAMLVEIAEHPFLGDLSQSDFHFPAELKQLMEQVLPLDQPETEEISVFQGKMVKFEAKPQKMFVEDLAALEKLNEDNITDTLHHKVSKGIPYTFVGDILLTINTNDMPPDIPLSVHKKYVFKGRSDNAPHVFAVADRAFQDMLHHQEPQHIIFAGETFSGKTTNMRLAFKHLTVLGDAAKGLGERLISILGVIHQLTNAGTALNPDSTRCAMQLQATFGTTGKLSGAIFWVYLLEKLRVSTTDMHQANFHIFYLFYDAMEAADNLRQYNLKSGRNYRYLRISENNKTNSKCVYIRDDPTGNVKRWKEFLKVLEDLDVLPAQIQTIQNILAAILVLGNIRFTNNDARMADVENPELAIKVAKLLNVDEKKFSWALINYCVVNSGVPEKRRHSDDEARDARDALASTIYSRMVDWIVNIINQKLTFGRSVFGDFHTIMLTDLFGFECFHRNHMEQLMINCINEQMMYYYNQRTFVSEMMEMEEEEIPHSKLHFYDNKPCIDNLMAKPTGLFYMIDDATKSRQGSQYITDTLAERKSNYVKRVNPTEFSVAHYTGKVTYDARDIADKNRDFVPPEMFETLRLSTDNYIKVMFTNQLTKAGVLTLANEDEIKATNSLDKKSKWGCAVNDRLRPKKLNTLSQGQYSQIHQMRTLAGVFRAASLEMLKGLSIGGAHFVRCVRAELDYIPRGFQTEMVCQQLKALSILDTANARKIGYPYRVSFMEFIRRYKFLAFDFEENVEVNKDNCRLLLIRLKMEGWVIGKTKVFLTYYNDEFLLRLYETQVKKIVKVQCMMRAFLARKMVNKKAFQVRQDSVQKALKAAQTPSQDEAALKIQKAYRGYNARKTYGPMVNKSGDINPEVASFMRIYAKRWRVKTIFQVLMHYRAARYQDMVNLSQQVHIYNQSIVASLKNTGHGLTLDKIDKNEREAEMLGPKRTAVRKIPFVFKDIPFFDTTYMCNPFMADMSNKNADPELEAWDAPFQRRATTATRISVSTQLLADNSSQTCLDDIRPSQKQERSTNAAIYNEYTRDSNTMKRMGGGRMGISSIREETSYEMGRNRGGSDYKFDSPNRDNFNRSGNGNNNNNNNKQDEYGASNKGSSYNRFGRIEPSQSKTPHDFSKPQHFNRPNQDFSRPQNFSRPQDFDRPSVHKKRFAPLTPDSPDLESRRHPMNSNYLNGKQFDASVNNPVKELQMLARQSSREMDDDDQGDAPFNFRAMLRKTDNRRASLKKHRAPMTPEHTRHGTSVYNSNELQLPSKPQSGRPNSNISDRSGLDSNFNFNINSCDSSRRPSVSSETSERPGGGGDGNRNINVGEYVQEEIAPGVILEGYEFNI